MAKTHRSIFIKEVKEAFPEVKAQINAENGLLHCEMHAFCDYVQSLIQKNETQPVIKAFQIIEMHFKSGNDALVNAICVSFLEHLDLGMAKGEPSWAYQHLPQALVEPYESLRKYHGI